MPVGLLIRIAGDLYRRHPQGLLLVSVLSQCSVTRTGGCLSLTHLLGFRGCPGGHQHVIRSGGAKP